VIVGDVLHPTIDESAQVVTKANHKGREREKRLNATDSTLLLLALTIFASV
jgi:hypothetical protein